MSNVKIQLSIQPQAQISNEQLEKVVGGVNFDQLRRENLDSNAVDFDQLRRENLDSNATAYLAQ